MTRANLLLAVASTLFAIFLLGAVELGLRLTGAGPERLSRLRYQQVEQPVLAPARRADGTRVLHPRDRRIAYDSVLRERPEGSLRVIVSGGSATHGLGYSPNASFASGLERLLRSALPDREAEVLNLGIVALASRQVAALVTEACRHYEPDVVVIYSGNNEFLEIHAARYAALHSTALERLGHWLTGTRIYGLAGGLFGRDEPTLAELELASDELRLSERTLVREIEVTRDEVGEITEAHAANLERMVDAAQASGTSIVLMTVASNWRWRGKEDLPEGWIEQLAGEGDGSADERALAQVEQELEASAAKERHGWLFRRAVLHERAGRSAEAARDYRAAMNADPHLRRALDAMNDRVKELARRRGVPVLDTVALLEDAATDGIVGFDAFYDYVHFTPRGAELVAAALFETLEKDELVSSSGFDVREASRARLAWLDSLESDPLDVTQWLGLGFDLSRLEARDLWKYDRMREALDQRIAADPHDVAALIHRGNAHSFDLRGAEAAERDYRAALTIAPDHPEARANLERLLAERAR